MARAANNTGRSRKEAKHVRLYEHVLRSDAYQSLDVYARSLLVEFSRRYNGNNNGKIHMSYREASAACKCSQKPIRRAFDTLQETGFIRIAKKGAFSVKIRHATEWILTEFPLGNELPTKDFMRWEKTELKPVTKKTRRTHGTGSAYSKHKSVNENYQNSPHSVPTGYRGSDNGDVDGVPRVYTYNIPYTPEQSAGKQPPKGQAQPSEVHGNVVQLKKETPESEILGAVGGFCKILPINKTGFDEIIKAHRLNSLDDGQIRSLVFQNSIRDKAFSMPTSQLEREHEESIAA